jgi:hypothetical protein
MAAEFSTSGTSNGVSFLVSAGIVYEIIAAACSSPQTTEINAGTRAPTLMKWVNIGMVQAAGFVILASLIDPSNAGPILAGGLLAGGLMYAQYQHARKAGLAEAAAGLPGTES